jgi:hypothetical protein
MPVVLWRECHHHVASEVSPFLCGYHVVPQLWLVWLRTCFLVAGAPARPRVRIDPSSRGGCAFDAKLPRQQGRPAATTCLSGNMVVATMLCFCGTPTLPTRRQPACVAPAQARLETRPRDQRSTRSLQAPTPRWCVCVCVSHLRSLRSCFRNSSLAVRW